MIYSALLYGGLCCVVLYSCVLSCLTHVVVCLICDLCVMLSGLCFVICCDYLGLCFVCGLQRDGVWCGVVSVVCLCVMCLRVVCCEMLYGSFVCVFLFECVC